MSEKPRILAFAGSLRKDSLNKKIVKIAAKAAAEAGAIVTYIDLKDYQVPVYDGDIEDETGIPVKAKEFKELMKSHHGFLIASPEYNSSISAVLKNLIDWASRPERGEPVLAAFKGKTAALLSASPGKFGGLRGLYSLREILQNVFVLVLPDMYSLSAADNAFNDDDTMKNNDQLASVNAIGENLTKYLLKTLE
jgi:NAD(P)H-dependent FMN reductase